MAADMIRNREMAMYSDELIAFWDSQSKGTDNMINIVRRIRLNVTVEYI